MGKLGPMTSQALGRSPYDDVVQGEGEGDLRAPVQLYDERGRPVNPETKRINKDVIRSHNEVMLVIGVAEPENGAQDPQAEMRIKQHENEEQIGRRLLTVGRVIEMGGLWGVSGLRHRILLYRQYAKISFYDLYRYERSQRSVANSFLAGLPSFVTSHALKQLSLTHSALRGRLWAESAVNYVRLHLQLFVFMQRMGLTSSSAWFPNLRYFIPFSDSSPIPAPPPITELSTRSVLQWLGVAALNVVPLAAFLGYTKLWGFVTRNVWVRIYDKLPTPTNRRIRQSPPPPPPPEPTNPSSSQSVGDNQPRNGRDISRDEATIRALEGQDPPPSEHPTLGAVRRQSTFSSRGDEYVSDDEETEVVSATLISFDVEANESTDTPPGVWSAELRPNMTDMKISAEPVYADNALTRLPSMIATDILTVVSSQVLVAPYEAFAFRLLARAFRQRYGLPLHDMYDPSPLGSLSWTAIANFLGLEMVYLMIEAECWGLMTILADLHRGCSADWSFFRVLRYKLWDDEEPETWGR